MPLLTRPSEFPTTLTVWANPSFTGPLSHAVSREAPAGVVDGDGRGMREPAVIAEATDLPLRPPPPPRAAPWRSVQRRAAGVLTSGSSVAVVPPREVPVLPEVSSESVVLEDAIAGRTLAAEALPESALGVHIAGPVEVGSGEDRPHEVGTDVVASAPLVPEAGSTMPAAGGAVGADSPREGGAMPAAVSAGTGAAPRVTAQRRPDRDGPDPATPHPAPVGAAPEPAPAGAAGDPAVTSSRVRTPAERALGVGNLGEESAGTPSASLAPRVQRSEEVVGAGVPTTPPAPARDHDEPPSTSGEMGTRRAGLGAPLPNLPVRAVPLPPVVATAQRRAAPDEGSPRGGISPEDPGRSTAVATGSAPRHPAPAMPAMPVVSRAGGSAPTPNEVPGASVPSRTASAEPTPPGETAIGTSGDGPPGAYSDGTATYVPLPPQVPHGGADPGGSADRDDEPVAHPEAAAGREPAPDLEASLGGLETALPALGPSARASRTESVQRSPAARPLPQPAQDRSGDGSPSAGSPTTVPSTSRPSASDAPPVRPSGPRPDAKRGVQREAMPGGPAVPPQVQRTAGPYDVGMAHDGGELERPDEPESAGLGHPGDPGASSPVGDLPDLPLLGGDGGEARWAERGDDRASDPPAAPNGPVADAHLPVIVSPVQRSHQDVAPTAPAATRHGSTPGVGSAVPPATVGSPLPEGEVPGKGPGDISTPPAGTAPLLGRLPRSLDGPVLARDAMPAQTPAQASSGDRGGAAAPRPAADLAPRDRARAVSAPPRAGSSPPALADAPPSILDGLGVQRATTEARSALALVTSGPPGVPLPSSAPRYPERSPGALPSTARASASASAATAAFLQASPSPSAAAFPPAPTLASAPAHGTPWLPVQRASGGAVSVTSLPLIRAGRPGTDRAASGAGEHVPQQPDEHGAALPAVQRTPGPDLQRDLDTPSADLGEPPPSAPAGAPPDTDALVTALTPRLLRRIREELLMDRERRGLRIDIR